MGAGAAGGDLGGGSAGKPGVTWGEMVEAGAARSPAVPFTGPLRARPSKDRHEFQRNRPPAAPPAVYDRTGGTLTPALAPGARVAPRSPGAVSGRARGGEGRCPAARARPGLPPRPPRGGGAAATWERCARRRLREAPPGGGRCGEGRPARPARGAAAAASAVRPTSPRRRRRLVLPVRTLPGRIYVAGARGRGGGRGVKVRLEVTAV